MTAIAVNILPAVPPVTTDAGQAVSGKQPAHASQQKFKALFDGGDQTDDSGHADTRPRGPSKKSSSDDDKPLVAIPFQSSPAKVLLPVSFGQLAPESAPETNPQESSETVPDVRPDTTVKPRAAEPAFAARVVETTPQVSAPLATTPVPKAAQPGPSAQASAPIPRQAPHPGSDAGTSGRQSDSSERDTARPQSVQQQQQVSAAPSPSAPQNSTFRDAISSSQGASPNVENNPQPQTPALEHVTASFERPASSQVSEISVRVAGPDQTSASIRLIDQSGELRVAVRASDPQVADSLRGNIDQLSSRLNSSGFSAEIFKPATPAAARAQESSQQSTSDKQQSPQQSWNGQTFRDQNNKHKRPDWVEEFYANNE